MRLTALAACCLVAACLSACQSGSAVWSGEPASGPAASPGGGEVHLATVASRITGALGEVCQCRPRPESSGAGLELCGYPVQVEHTVELHASTNGQRVRITSGMLGFFESDDELAFVLAHELSHILLGHAGAFNGLSPRSAEEEADRLGIRIVLAAHFDTERAAEFPERLVRSYPAAGGQNAIYPRPANRTAMIRSALRADPGALAKLSLAGDCAQ